MISEYFNEEQLVRENIQMIYIYNFNSYYQHNVEFQGLIKSTEEINNKPKIIKGERACPPEGLEGMKAYNDFLSSINNVYSEDYSEQINWLFEQTNKTEFEPYYFNIENVVFKISESN